jgi:hypothetical protein
MIVRLRRDRLSVEKGFDRLRARAGARPVARGGLLAVLHDREHLSEPFVFAWLDEGPGRERAGAIEPVLDMEDAVRCPLEALLDYPAFVRLLFADYDVAFLHEEAESASSAWDARVRWRRHVFDRLVDVDWTVPRGQEWRDAFECQATPAEPVRMLNQIRRTPGSERRHGQEAISLSWAAPPAPPESRQSVPIDDLFDYDRFCMRYVQTTKRFFVYGPAEEAASAFASAAAWRRYVHGLLLG